MKTINIVNGPMNASAIIQGCMRMPALTKEAAAKVIRTSLSLTGLWPNSRTVRKCQRQQ